MSTNTSSLAGGRWQKLKILNADFELPGSGDVLAFRELEEDRVRDEQARSRMDDEGCPNGRQLPDPRQPEAYNRVHSEMKEGTQCVAITKNWESSARFTS